MKGIVLSSGGEEEIDMRQKPARILPLLLCLCLVLSLFGFCAPKASADTPIIKVLSTTSYTPVALMDVNFITAATSTPGIYLLEYGWFDAATGNPVREKFGTRRVAAVLVFATHDGYEFDPQAAAYLNNERSVCTVSEDRHYLTLTREYDPMIWAPSVIKDPGDEYLDEGGYASFVTSASYAEGFQWYAYDPNTNTTQSINAIPNGVDIISDGETSKLNIYGVPAWMDGWQVFCTFVGALGSQSNSGRATLHVRSLTPPVPIAEEAEPEETQVPTPTPSPEPTPEPTPSPEPTPAPSPEPAHVHVFPETWERTEDSHWRECSCGERIEQGAHTYEWTVQQPATRSKPGVERGTCSVCGHETERELPYQSPSPTRQLVTYGVGGLVALTVLVLIVDSIRTAVRRRRAGKSGRH